MSIVDHSKTSFSREGFILSLSLEDGHVGYGEVSVVLSLHACVWIPIGISRKSIFYNLEIMA